jgi:hypothetical protein
LCAAWNATRSRARPRRDEGLPARGGEDALDEALADARVGEPAFLLHRQQRERVDERGGEEPASDATRRAALAVDAHAQQTA